MGKSRRRSSSWWTASTGGVAHWVLVVLVGVLAIGTGGIAVAALSANESTAAPGPVRTDFDFGSSRPPITSVTFLGDSWSCGSGVSEDVEANRYAALTADTLGWRSEILCIGGSGYTTGGTAYANRLPDLIAQAPDVVVVQGSTNDKTDAATVTAAASDLLGQLRQGLPEARIVVVGPAYTPINDDAVIDRTRGALESAAASAGAEWVDPAANGWLDLSTDFAADRTHPNDEGHRKFAERLSAALAAAA